MQPILTGKAEKSKPRWEGRLTLGNARETSGQWSWRANGAAPVAIGLNSQRAECIVRSPQWLADPFEETRRNFVIPGRPFNATAP